MTYYVALPFVRDVHGELMPGEAKECKTAGAAVRMARHLAFASAGTVAFSRTGDPAIGEFDEAVVIQKFGEVPSLDDLIDAAV
jgi:hypothetical protein